MGKSINQRKKESNRAMKMEKLKEITVKIQEKAWKMFTIDKRGNFTVTPKIDSKNNSFKLHTHTHKERQFTGKILFKLKFHLN